MVSENAENAKPVICNDNPVAAAVWVNDFEDPSLFSAQHFVDLLGEITRRERFLDVGLSA